MQILSQIQQRIHEAVRGISQHPEKAAELVRRAQDPKFGDYQANCAMSLKDELGGSPRDIAQSIVDSLNIEDLCEPPEIAGPGFINLRLKDQWLGSQATGLLQDPRAGVETVETPRTVVVDYSSPNVAKPMHVGHIRSTVIGNAICRMLRFVGHNVISDNHLGDWGTQFGMVIYGYKNFLDEEAFESQPVLELLRLYRQVNSLKDYHEAKAGLAKLELALSDATGDHEQAIAAADAETDKKAKKKADKNVKAAARRIKGAQAALSDANHKIESIESSPELNQLASEHATIGNDVLAETAKLHEGDAVNVALWEKVLPHCRDEIDKIYDRLNISFDYQYGESFFHKMLPGVIETLQKAEMITESEGALCVFMPEFDSPMIVRKRDGAFLYATTDLATLEYRTQNWDPDEIIYITDHRQEEHFEKLFAVGKQLGCKADLKHVPFGTVTDEEGKAIKTRSGSSAGLEGLLDDAVAAAYKVTSSPDRGLSEDEKQHIASVVGHGAIKYADLGHNRTSDYKFSLQKMVALDGNTAAYLLYSYARTQNILAKGQTSEEQVIEEQVNIVVQSPAERAIALLLLQFDEAIAAALEDYRPNVLVDYLYDVAKAFASFFEQCPVLKAETDQLRQSRLGIVTATGKVLRVGLDLLGIEVVPRM